MPSPRTELGSFGSHDLVSPIVRYFSRPSPGPVADIYVQSGAGRAEFLRAVYRPRVIFRNGDADCAAVVVGRFVRNLPRVVV